MTAQDNLSASDVEQFRNFLRLIWMDNTEEEAQQQWLRRVNEYPQKARQDLECLDLVIASPPANLVEILNDEGWIFLSHEPDSETVIDYTYEEYVDWLRQMINQFRTVYDAA